MKLQTAPSGLLGWFNQKVLGQNPDTFGNVVTPVVEIGDNYLLQGQLVSEQVVGTMVATDTSSLAQFTVPAASIWRVLCVAGQVSIDPADVAKNFAWIAYLTLNGITAYLAGGALAAGSAGRVGAYFFPRPLLLPPGARITIYVTSSAAVANPATPHCTILRQVFDA